MTYLQDSEAVYLSATQEYSQQNTAQNTVYKTKINHFTK